MKLVSRADMARLTSKSRAAITKACKGKLAPACSGDRIDLEHPAAAAYLALHQTSAAATRAAGPKPRRSPAKKARKPAKKTSKRARRSTAGKAKPEPRARAAKRATPKATPTAPQVEAPFPMPDEFGMADELADWTLRRIVDQFGTLRAYKDHLEAHVKRERALGHHLKNEMAMGNLIERDRVQTHAFGILNGGFERLLRDVPRTLASRVHALATSGGSVEEIEKLIRDGNSSVLKPVRDKVLRNLRRKRKHMDLVPDDEAGEED